MNERISTTDKKPEAKSQNSVSQIRRKTESFQYMNSPVDRILFLQRTIGNQAVGRLIKSGALQAKLMIGQSGDIYEQEADRVAEQVMRMPDVSSEKNARVQRKCPKCLKELTGLLGKDKKDEKLQVKEAPFHAPEVTPRIEANINALKGSGQPLTESTRAFFEPRFGQEFSKARVHTDVQYQKRQHAGHTMLPPSGTNYIFDTFQVTEAHLSDPDIIARFNALSRAGLLEYRNRVVDPAVQTYITQLLATIPSVPCTANEVSRTNTKAETARTASVPWVQQARVALDRLHSRWIDHKADLLAGRRTLSGQIVCAFDSNFNIMQRDPDYGVRQISVMSRLRQLESRLSRDVPFACQPDDDPVCLGNDRDTVAYVRGGQPPIHLCSQFRDDPDSLNQQSTVVHEYTHLLLGVHDQGGYALGDFGAQVMTCQTGAKFKATSDVLTNTADALTGFVMHIGQTDAKDIRVR